MKVFVGTEGETLRAETILPFVNRYCRPLSAWKPRFLRAYIAVVLCSLYIFAVMTRPLMNHAAIMHTSVGAVLVVDRGNQSDKHGLRFVTASFSVLDMHRVILSVISLIVLLGLQPARNLRDDSCLFGL